MLVVKWSKNEKKMVGFTIYLDMTASHS